MAGKIANAMSNGTKRKRSEAEYINPPQKRRPISLQIITGSYERVLHGITATIPTDGAHTVSFSNNFLFNAHSSSIRCLTVAPPSDSTPQNPSKRILATGSSDERINLYQINNTTSHHSTATTPALAALPLLTTTSPGNRELGSLLHHASTITALHFPSRGKLLSASLDNTIAISRSRDWTVLSTIRAPIPKAAGRPSGDTAAPGEVPAGINSVAVHPSAKLCLSVGQGERCMRLWNLVTGKRAGVLTFEKSVLAQVGEGKWRGGEGRQVVWSADGEEFAVGFEKGAVVYGLDCQVRGVARAPNTTKICQIKYVPMSGIAEVKKKNILALSTEDGRILFYDTHPSAPETNGATSAPAVPFLTLLAQLGATTRGSRVKDFETFPLTHSDSIANGDGVSADATIALALGTSDGSVRLWSISASEILSSSTTSSDSASASAEAAEEPSSKKPKSTTATTETSTVDPVAVNGTTAKAETEIRQVGTLLGTFETGRRITCLTGFVMGDAEGLGDVDGDGEEAPVAEAEDEEEEWEGFGGDE